MTGAWRLDPFARIVRFVGDFPEPNDDELADYGWGGDRGATRGRERVHGTEGGYHTHKRRDEDPCEPCRLAANFAAAERRRRKREAA